MYCDIFRRIKPNSANIFQEISTWEEIEEGSDHFRTNQSILFCKFAEIWAFEVGNVKKNQIKKNLQWTVCLAPILKTMVYKKKLFFSYSEREN